MLYIEQDDIEALSYQLYDQSGRLVLERDNTEAFHTYMLSLDQYPDGLYYLHIINAEQRLVEKIVISR